MSILKQPLVHFLFFGLLLFLLFEMTGTFEDDGSKVIVVDRERLLTHMQFRSRAFDANRFDDMLAEMSDAEREQLITDYVQEEALHREALALGLDANDYIIRRRLIQKIEFLSRGFEMPAPTEQELTDYYNANRDKYFLAPSRTFTHVFVNAERYESPEAALAFAEQQLTKLNQEQVTFSDALQYGDRFPYHKNYVDRNASFVASHFGTQFAQSLFSLPVDEWQGPVRSAYGWHLVLVANAEMGRFPEMSEVLDQLTYDATQAALKARTENAVQQVVDSYKVEVAL